MIFRLHYVTTTVLINTYRFHHVTTGVIIITFRFHSATDTPVRFHYVTNRVVIITFRFHYVTNRVVIITFRFHSITQFLLTGWVLADEYIQVAQFDLSLALELEADAHNVLIWATECHCFAVRRHGFLKGK
jgi:hypothetical protein